ncbi:hypothetical protein Tco_0371905 [Tanacetum coccineum]
MCASVPFSWWSFAKELDLYLLEQILESMLLGGVFVLVSLQLSSAALAVLTTRPACPPSLILCLSSLRESLSSVPYVYGQSLKDMPSQSAASRSESYIPGDVSK